MMFMDTTLDVCLCGDETTRPSKVVWQMLQTIGEETHVAYSLPLVCFCPECAVRFRPRMVATIENAVRVFRSEMNV